MGSIERLVKDFITELSEKKPYLFWDIKDPLSLSVKALVEIVLNRGDFDDFLKLADTIGLHRVAEIFYKQVSKERKIIALEQMHYRLVIVVP
ncbi:MAG: hypothetical protein N2257_08855 [Thermodesulfovibrionales bacterium]|nr:hypothetical protein [Thermodesulfovibrionales bacterium]